MEPSDPSKVSTKKKAHLTLDGRNPAPVEVDFRVCKTPAGQQQGHTVDGKHPAPVEVGS